MRQKKHEETTLAWNCGDHDRRRRHDRSANSKRVSPNKSHGQHGRNGQQHRSPALEFLGNLVYTRGPFWIADNNSGLSTVYFADGTKTTPTVTIPSAQNNPCTPGCPTGTVSNSSNNFGGNVFIFDTEDGTLSAWQNGSAATIVVDNSSTGAVYKGLAMISNGSGVFLLAANFNSGKIDVFDTNFKPAALAGTFTDPNLPAAFAPHGIHVVNGQVFVAYGVQDVAKHDPTPGVGSGIVDIFDFNGNFVKRFAAQGTLNAPWGIVATPASFGAFANDILVGNFGDGTITAFDQNGNSLGQVKDGSGNVITNPGLWDLVFGQNGTGDPNTFYLTAGGANQNQGLFATLVPTQSVSGGDFSVSASQSSLNVGIGQSANTSISVSALNGFNSAVSLSCSGLVNGLTCSFSPNTVTPGASAVTSTLTLSVASTYMFARANPQSTVFAIAIPFLGLAGLVSLRRRIPQSRRARMIGSAGLFAAILALGLFLAGCGSGNKNNMASPGSTQSITVTAQSGTITHTASLSVMIH